MSTPRSGRKDIKSDESPNGVQKKTGVHDVQKWELATSKKKKIFVAIGGISRVKKNDVTWLDSEDPENTCRTWHCPHRLGPRGLLPKERDEAVIIPPTLVCSKLRHSSCVQARIPVGTSHSERITKSLAPLKCLMPPFLPPCVTPVHVPHTLKTSGVISWPPGLYVDHHSINEHLTRTMRPAH